MILRYTKPRSSLEMLTTDHKNIFQRLHVSAYGLILLLFSLLRWAPPTLRGELISSAGHLAIIANNSVLTQQCCCGNTVPILRSLPGHCGE